LKNLQGEEIHSFANTLQPFYSSVQGGICS
jgi:hypothetical protein